MNRSSPLLSCVLLLAAAPAAADVSGTDLIEDGPAYDGKAVDFSGEVIGDRMDRGDHVWINVSDGTYAIGVWAPRSALPAIREYGSYEARGDTVRIHGVFHRTCAEHGGDTDIHAETVTVVAPGAPTPHEVHRSSLILAGALLLTSLGTWLAWRRKERALRAGGGAAR